MQTQNVTPFRPAYSISDGFDDEGNLRMRPISQEEWDKPCYFKATRDKPGWWNDRPEYATSNYALYGCMPSLYIGTHAGWVVDGKQFPRDAFVEHHFAGDFTGGAPVGLTPRISL